ncbi:MAG: recombinase family protein [Bacteroidales bacterium]|nr:recombinase family protein [Bacteroidales bacterium]
MNTIIWSRVSSQSQDNQRQILNLKQVAYEKGWTVKRVFEETVSGTVKTTERKEFNKLLDYAVQHQIQLILVSEISRIGRKVVDILTTVDTFHKKGIALSIQQFNMISFTGWKREPDGHVVVTDVKYRSRIGKQST